MHVPDPCDQASGSDVVRADPKLPRIDTESPGCRTIWRNSVRVISSCCSGVRLTIAAPANDVNPRSTGTPILSAIHCDSTWSVAFEREMTLSVIDTLLNGVSTS